MVKTLRSKLLFIFLSIIFLSLSFIGYISYQSQKEVLMKQLENSFFLFSDSLAANIDQFITETVIDLSYLAENPIIKDPNSNLKAIKSQFLRFTKLYAPFDNVTFVDMDGIVKVDLLDHSLIGQDLSDRRWFMKAKAYDRYFSDVFYSKFSNKPILVIAAIVKDNNDQPIGVLRSVFDLEVLGNYIYNSTLQPKTDKSYNTFLFNDDGVIISRPDRKIDTQVNYFNKNNVDIGYIKEMVKNKQIYVNKNTEEVSAFSKIQTGTVFKNNWYLAVSVSKSEFFAPLDTLLFQYIFYMILSFLVTTLAIVKFSNYLIDPITKLVVATSDLAVGRKQNPITLNSYSEINQLSEKYNYMIEQVEKREEEHKKTSLILESTSNGIMAFDKEKMVITTFNKTCETIFHIPKDKVLEKTVSQVVNNYPAFKVFIEQANIMERISKNSNPQFWEFQLSLNGKTSYFHLVLKELPKHNQNKEAEILVIIRDLSEQKIMENEILRTEKLKVIGELAASFAHEIRNPLTTIRGFIQLLDISNDNHTKEQKYYKIILQEIDRINGIVTDLMCMAKPNGDQQFILTNLNQIIEDITLLYDGQGSLNKVLIEKELDHSVPLFFTYGSKLKQVFINLIKNAFEAMPNGGTLTIKTIYIKEESSVEISIADTGIGMDQQTIANLRKLFFTTKSSGTGLGLPMCYMIIEDMDGSLTVSSKVGKGTTFTIKLYINSAPYHSQDI